MRNKFSLSNYKLLTGNMGYLIPVNWLEVLPGDTFQGATQALIRTAPLNAPVMHPTAVRFHHFFVRNRLLWDDDGGSETGFEAFITGGSDGTKTPTHPYVSLNATTVSSGDLYDYLGIPPANYTGSGLAISALPFRAYNMIYNSYYRDQDHCTELTVDTTDGSDSSTKTLQKVAWPKDPINIARSSDTLGDSVTIPLLGEAPLWGDNMDWDASDDNANYPQVRDAQGSSANLRKFMANTATLYGGSSADGTGELKADMTQASGVDIADLLLAFGLQSFQEARNKYGHRYVDWQRYYGVRPSETLAYQPEYLGGGRQVLQFSEVLSTDGANTGDMKGHGITALRTNTFRRTFNEHGIFMTLMSVVPKPIYANMIPKKWNRTTKEEYFTRELQFIGDEIVENKEVYSEHSTPSGTFGYSPRYESYRHEFSEIAGEFNPGDTNDHWHLAIAFSGDPSLNSTFIECTPATDIFQSGSADQLYCMVNNSVKARRKISKEGKTKIVF